jgi:tRNA-specific 2-thiouridylase
MKVLLALSGGVDSSVAALLLKEQGYAVTALYMKNWINEENVLGDCPWQSDIEDARAVCEHLKIEFRVVNFIREYRDRVVQYLVEGYRRGITPNPDVMCNREMKFGVLLDYAKVEGFEAVATGHYCRSAIQEGEKVLLEGVDKNKDQSYFLSLISPEQLDAALFPIGHLAKPEVRARARSAGLPNADKKDSQGICFIGQVRMSDFLIHFIPENPGAIVTVDGRVLGQHKGLHCYTLGQRKGIGIPSNTDNEHFVVIGKDPDKNHLIVAFDHPQTPGLWQTKMQLHQLSWVTRNPLGLGTHLLLAKPRYRDPSVPISLEICTDGTAHITFEKAQRALAPGQVCALYHGDRLLGGGIFF